MKQRIMKHNTTYNKPLQCISFSKPNIIVSIDPDSILNGVCTLTLRTRAITTQSLSFPETLDYLQYIKRQAEVTNSTYIVLVEAGWLNTGNWHLTKAESIARAAAKGNSVGRNHETGRKIIEMCQHWQMPHEEIKPLNLRIKGHNIWKGKDGKITHEELAAFTGIKGRTNQEERDAALIAWNYAGFPLTKKVAIK